MGQHVTTRKAADKGQYVSCRMVFFNLTEHHVMGGATIVQDTSFSPGWRIKPETKRRTYGTLARACT